MEKHFYIFYIWEFAEAAETEGQVDDECDGVLVQMDFLAAATAVEYEEIQRKALVTGFDSD